MICQYCGRDNPSEIGYCQSCGNPLSATQAPPPPVYGNYSNPQQGYYPPPLPGYPPVMGYGPTNYAGIGSRFLAALIDGMVIGIPIGIISTVLSAMMAVRVFNRTNRDPSFNPGMAADSIGTVVVGVGFIMIISVLLTWAYFAIMESSSWQGTVGKRIMGIQVADLNGARITLGRATLRLAVKAFLSGWFLIGYIMALYTQRKQALHDLIAGTLVLTKQGYTAIPGSYPQQYPTPGYPQQPSVCPYCGGATQPNARFCSNCGRNL